MSIKYKDKCYIPNYIFKPNIFLLTKPSILTMIIFVCADIHIGQYGAYEYRTSNKQQLICEHNINFLDVKYIWQRATHLIITFL